MNSKYFHIQSTTHTINLGGNDVLKIVSQAMGKIWDIMS
jgi:hypothetical protein